MCTGRPSSRFSAALQGAIVVQGIEKLQPAVAGLPERVLVMRDQVVPGAPTPGGKIPSWDLTLNYVPISYPDETPGVIQVRPGRREFWRVVNAGADTMSDIVLKYDGVPQPMEVVALDGVPTGSQDGTGTGKAVWVKHIELAPASRAEFIVTTPTAGVKTAEFVSNRVDVGPAGDNDPTRTMALLQFQKGGNAEAMATMPIMPAASTSTAPAQLFDGLDSAKVDTQRRLYFSEVFEDSRKSKSKSRSNIETMVRSSSTSLNSATNRNCSVPPTRRPSLRRRARLNSGRSKIARRKITRFTSTRFTSS